MAQASNNGGTASAFEFDLNAPLMSSQGLYVIYKGKEGAENVVALRGLNVEVGTGEFLAIVGPSGSGKSSLLRCIGGLQHPSAGLVKYYGVDITRYDEQQLVPFRRDFIGFVFQEGNLLESLTGFQNVLRTLRYAGVNPSEAKERASEVLTQLGLKSRMHDLPKRLSGGERQRVSIARALANRPRFILADEPTGNIDYANTENVMGIFRDLHKELETSFLLVTHSQHVASYADRKLELRDGRFTGEHGSDFDLQNLDESRAVIIDDDGSLSLPPEMLGLLTEYGNLWEFRVDVKENLPRIIGFPQGTQKGQVCPVCNNPVEPTDFQCKNCGANLR